MARPHPPAHPFTLRRPSPQTSVIPAGSGPMLALLAATHTVDDLYQGAVPALLPFLALERHYTYAGLTGLTLAATFLSSAVQPGFGMLTDRQRRGWLIAAGLLVAGLGVGVSGLGDSYLITWLAIAVSGVGVAAYHPEATRTARGIAGDSTQAMSWFSVGGTAGLALGPLVVTPVLLLTGLPGTPLLAIPAVATAALLAVRRPWHRADAGAAGRTSPRARASGPADRPADGPGRDDWRSFGRLIVVVTARSIAYFGLASLLAVYVIRKFGEPTVVGSAALTAFVVAGVAGSLAGGWLADRWQRPAPVPLRYAAAIPALVVLAVAPDVAVAFGAAIVAGLALFTPFAVQVTLGQDYLPNRIGTASGGPPCPLGVLACSPALSFAMTYRLREPRPGRLAARG